MVSNVISNMTGFFKIEPGDESFKIDQNFARGALR
jgi:hypothetical protein